MKSAHVITVLLAEDHTIVREGLRKLLEGQSDIEVIGEAATGREAVAMALALRPDVVIMDIAMPQLNGLEATRRICESVPETRVLILSAHSDEAYVQRVMELGAAGYLVKQTSAQFLAEAIREVRKGNAFYSPAVARQVRRRNQRSLDHKGQVKSVNVSLSHRELEVLQQVAEGAPNKQIASDLGISTKTVEKHRNNLMNKLDIHDTAGLTRYAISAGIIESSVQLTIL
jgi:DNA-binding NarL/FixJ family response regulator